jgi:hypothetical protein
MTEQEPSKLVSKQEQLPCGCVQIEYSDKRVEVRACPPHAFAEAGRLMHLAGQMLNAAAGRLLEEQQRIINSQIADAINKSANKGPSGIIKP